MGCTRVGVADDDQPDLSAFEGATTGDDASPDGTPDGTRNGDSGPGASAEGDGSSRPRLADLNRDGRVALGVALLEHLERDSLPLSDVVDRIETITTNPALTREILDTAELRGVIDRDGGRIRTRRGSFVRFDRQVVRRAGDYECRRCGANLDVGHFVRFDAGELGPFGPECVRRVVGRS